MKKMSDVKKSNRGRTKTLTDSTRKRNKKEDSIKYNKTRVSIGDEYDRWTELKDVLRLKTHAEVAKLLLDRYELASSPLKRKKPNEESVISKDVEIESETNSAIKATTSTPSNLPVHFMSDVSGISSSDRETANKESDMSGIEEIEREVKTCMEKSCSFINPFELTVELSEGDFGDDDQSSDEDYEPSFNLSIRTNSKGMKLEDEQDDEDIDLENDDNDQSEIEPSPGIHHIRTADDITEFVSDSPFLVYYNSILTLAKTNVHSSCQIKGCGTNISITREIIASALYLKWICANGHVVHKWCSQPMLNRRMHGGDLMFASAILLSGSNFKKMSMFCKFLQLPILSQTTFNKIQRTYLVPSIDQYWVDHQNGILDLFLGKDVVILGDGRMDSPGHCAQYCSYTFMENESKKILCIITMDKRATEKKSTLLEKACFLKGLRFLREKRINVVEIITDAHTQIAYLMKKEFPEIKHSFDVWHGAKNFGKKIIKVGQEKQNKPLLEWTKDLVNHFWYAAEICNTQEEYIGVWRGILHHVINEHEWLMPGSDGSSSCKHGPLSSDRDKGWLERDSVPHVALRKIILDKRFLNKIPYYLNFRSTGELEIFQNLILMYASKRHSYRPPAYRVRNLLAALDHNSHAERPVMLNQNGTIRYQRSYNKKTGRWSASPVKTEKRYIYITELLNKIVTLRLADQVGMGQKVVLEPDDPRRISAVLAPVPPPPTHEIVAEQKSRFGTDESIQSANRTNNIAEDSNATIDYYVDQ